MITIPSSAKAVLPNESPILGCPVEPSAVARYLGRTAAGVGQYRGALRQAQHSLSRVQSDGVAEISETLERRLSVGALALTQTAETARSAFAHYAAEIDRVHTAARWVEERVEGALSVIRGQHATIDEICGVIGVRVDFGWRAGPPAAMPTAALVSVGDGAFAHSGGGEAGDSAAEVLVLRARYEHLWAAAVSRWRSAADQIETEVAEWNRLREDRSAAELVLMASLHSTALGQLIAVSEATTAARRRTVAYGIAGELWGSSRPPVPSATQHLLLTRLIGTRSGADIWRNPPPPGQVAENWDSLTPTEQQRLIAEVPWVIGNLAGLPFQVRDQANRRLLEYYALRHDGLSPECVELLRELAAVLQTDTGDLSVSLVALNLNGEVPMVAVGYGPLDASASLTWEVPGMSSDAHLALGTWHQASRNLHGAQDRMLNPKGSGAKSSGRAERQPAVVAFLAYDTPHLVSVLSAQSARVGARRLAAELDGAAATRGQGMSLPVHAVVAHSYGTPVAANALTLTEFPVQSLTMLGSAGLDSGMTSALSDLHVERDRTGAPRVFTTLAAGDQLAPLGAALSDRAQPNPGAVVLGQTHISGAFVFGSDGFGELRATDGHSVIGAGSRGPLGSNASDGHGYLDSDTQALVGTAAVSLGDLRQVPGRLSRDGEHVRFTDTPWILAKGSE